MEKRERRTLARKGKRKTGVIYLHRGTFDHLSRNKGHQEAHEYFQLLYLSCPTHRLLVFRRAAPALELRGNPVLQQEGLDLGPKDLRQVSNNAVGQPIDRIAVTFVEESGLDQLEDVLDMGLQQPY